MYSSVCFSQTISAPNVSPMTQHQLGAYLLSMISFTCFAASCHRNYYSKYGITKIEGPHFVFWRFHHSKFFYCTCNHINGFETNLFFHISLRLLIQNNNWSRKEKIRIPFDYPDKRTRHSQSSICPTNQIIDLVCYYPMGFPEYSQPAAVCAAFKVADGSAIPLVVKMKTIF